MNKKIAIKIGRSIAFILILAIILYEINGILLPKSYSKNAKWPASSTFNQFYHMEENSIDVLFMGSSVVANAFSPQEIYDNFGIRSYNLATQQQSIFFNYYWLKEALNYQSPKVVVLDTKFLFTLHPENPLNTTEGIGREIVDNMNWSSNKREMINDICELDETQSKLSFYLTNIRYHSRWTELDESDFNTNLSNTDPLKGQAVITDYADDEYTPFVPNDLEIKSELNSVMVEYFAKIVDLCNENDIQLVLISLPDAMTDAMNNALCELSTNYEVPYYNLCLADYYNAIGAERPKENVVEHENIWGAIKTSLYIGNLLQSEYGVASMSDRQWDETSAYYKHLLNNAEISHIEDFGEYLKTLNSDKDYVTLISVKDDGFTYVSEGEIELLNQLGLKAPFTDMFRYSYCAVVDLVNGDVEQLSDGEVVTVSGGIAGTNDVYELTSGGGNAGVTCGIAINGINYEVNAVGINFVVYDRASNSIVDKVCFWRNENGLICRRL